MFIKYTDESKLQIHWKAGLKFQIEKLFGEEGEKKNKQQALVEQKQLEDIIITNQIKTDQKKDDLSNW